jgi:hypothetical protein
MSPHHALPIRRVATNAVRSAIVLLLGGACPAFAQDFELPAPAWPPGPAGLWLERALPPAHGAPVLEAGIVRWHGIDALVTRSLAAGAGWRAFRGGLGLAQTGEPDLGWTTLATALGAVVPHAGASLRIAARRDRTSRFGFDARGAAVGGEAGGGAWIDAGPRIHVWASAPQVWTRGSAPPLERPLAIGAAADLGSVRLWLDRSGVPGGTHGGREAGLSTVAGPFAVWLLARDRPLRGGFGLAARAAPLEVAAQVESHPVLRETARLSVRLGGGR